MVEIDGFHVGKYTVRPMDFSWLRKTQLLFKMRGPPLTWTTSHDDCGMNPSLKSIPKHYPNTAQLSTALKIDFLSLILPSQKKNTADPLPPSPLLKCELLVVLDFRFWIDRMILRLPRSFHVAEPQKGSQNPCFSLFFRCLLLYRLRVGHGLTLRAASLGSTMPLCLGFGVR